MYKTFYFNIFNICKNINQPIYLYIVNYQYYTIFCKKYINNKISTYNLKFISAYFLLEKFI